MRGKPTSCQGCPAASQGVGFVPGHGNPHARIAVVGQGPGQQEAHQGQPFVGASGMRLDGWLHAAGLQRTDLWVTNAVWCWLRKNGKDREPTAAEAKWCWNAHVGPELDTLPNLQGVVLVGVPAQKAVLGFGALRHCGAAYRVRLPATERNSLEGRGKAASVGGDGPAPQGDVRVTPASGDGDPNGVPQAVPSSPGEGLPQVR